MKPTFFATPIDLRKWFAKHHKSATELLIGYHKRHTGKPSVTWQESVDEALCVGWIDGIRKSLDADSYTIRFTRRRAGSIWSAVNIRRVAVLDKEGRMQPAGLEAFARRKENKSGIYSYEQRPQDLPEPYATEFRKNKKAWTFFQAQIPSYRKATTWWVISAKKEETRLHRVRVLISRCASGQLHPQLLSREKAMTARPGAHARGE
jgi:uncharacterized protein YdeI (YjbR/CyaY-like superfamily)